MTFSGGEPLLQLEFLRGCLRLCKENGISTAVDTAGNVSFQSFDAILEYTDFILYDVKLLDSELHKKHTGAPNKGIVTNLRRLCENRGKTEIIIRTLLLPGINDNDQYFEELAEFIHSLRGAAKTELLPYNNMGESKYAAIGEKCRYSGVKPPGNDQIGHYMNILK